MNVRIIQKSPVAAYRCTTWRCIAPNCAWHWAVSRCGADPLITSLRGGLAPSEAEAWHAAEAAVVALAQILTEVAA